MRFRNAFHITMDNFSSAFKMLLYRLVVAVIAFSIVYVILRLALAVIVESAEWEILRGMTEEFFRALFSGDSAVLQTFQSDFHTALADFLRCSGGTAAPLRARSWACALSICSPAFSTVSVSLPLRERCTTG